MRPLMVAAVAFAALGAGYWIPEWSRDEAATVMVVRRPLDQVWRTWAFDPALEPSYLVADLWAAPSTSALWLRLPSVLAATMTAVLVVSIALRFVALPIACATGAVFVVLPAVTRYAQEARPYAMTMLLSALAVQLWVVDRRLTGRRAIGLTATLIALGLSHAYALLILPVLLLVAVLAPELDRRRESIALARSGGAALVLLSPFLWLVSRGARGQPDLIPLTPPNLAVEALRLPVAVLRPSGAVPLGAIMLLLALSGLILGARTVGPIRSLAVLAAVWLLLPPLLLVTVQLLTGAPGLVARYWTFVLPGLALATAPLFDTATRRARWLGPAMVGVVVVVGLPTHVTLRGVDGHAGLGWATAVAALDRPPLAEAAVVVEGSIYRTLLVHRPTITERMPLVRDPAPSGRILPQTARSGSPGFERLRSAYDRIVVLQNRPGSTASLPDEDDFPVARTARRVMSEPAVFCSFFGDPLAVFTTPAALPSVDKAQGWAETLMSLNPQQVRCRAAARS